VDTDYEEKKQGPVKLPF
jgi:hypothetical protein